MQRTQLKIKMSHVEQTATKNWRIKAFYKLSVSTGKINKN
jgi:hypothetical protein